MPTLELTKLLIDDLKPQAADTVYWDQGLRGFGVKVTPAGRKVFIVMYRTTDEQRRLRKYTLGPYGVMTLVSARTAAPVSSAAAKPGSPRSLRCNRH